MTLLNWQEHWRAWWRENPAKIRAAGMNVGRAFELVWEGHPPSLVAMVACTLIAAGIPAGQAYAAKLIVDSVVAGAQAGVDPMAGLQAVAPWLLLELGLVVLDTAVSQARSLAEHVLHARINVNINTRIIRKALELDLTYFENAEYYDKLQNARREADWRSLQIVDNGFYLIQNLITLASFVVLLIGFSPWLAALIFAATVPAFIAQNRFAELSFRVLSWRAPEARRLNYLEHLLTDYDAVKEVKLFNLGEPLLGRYADLFWKFLREDQAIAQKRSLASLGWGLLATLSYYGAYAWIVWRAVGAAITLGDMTLFLSITRSSQSRFQSILYGLSSLYENGLFLSNLFAFLELTPAMRGGSGGGLPVPEHFSQGIEFRNVSFRYQGHTEDVLRGVSFLLRPGEKVALVGPNGAGKTTLIKLLTRLYDPTGGQILLDGVDLRDYDLLQLRQRIGVIFQDFVRYHLAASENVGFGQVEAIDNLERIMAAAQKSGADEVIRPLPEGYATVLGRWFSGGRDLSGGQWQKIALGRAFMRDCELIVLDEPTAALDAENEMRVFEQFRALTEDRMAVLISHRFSTVRMADRIFVIEGGTITESGSHADLVARGGTYARLFALQAESYR
ncbi:MAG TPA: ABC transporter ATP-binding protein [Anaerolineales bacterium]|nr:ABC transporter ATP-binding protein [Anaerolineales bacterium]